MDEKFNSNAATLAYDDNGNLTDDGVYKFAYDAWNRMVQVKRRPDAQTTIATYAYDAVNRRQSKVVTNCGIENTAGDGGDTTVHFYYSNGGQPPSAGGVPWNIAETRNGSNQTTRQWCWGAQYIDEVLFMDVNGDPSADNDADIDVTTGNESGESPADKRYFYHQDRNWNVVALTEYSPPGSPSNVSGRVAERYAYTPYGECVVLTGDGGNGEMGARRGSSFAGLGCAYQGLADEHSVVANRRRSYSATLLRFFQRDPLGNSSNMNPYARGRRGPTQSLDPSGLVERFHPECPPCDEYGLICAAACAGRDQIPGIRLPDLLGRTLCDPPPFMNLIGTFPCCCICDERIDSSYPEPVSREIVRDCVRAHELVHLRNCGINEHSHCYAYTAELLCLLQHLTQGECNTRDCVQALREAIVGEIYLRCFDESCDKATQELCKRAGEAVVDVLLDRLEELGPERHPSDYGEFIPWRARR